MEKTMTIARLLCVVIVLQCLILVGVWGGGSILPEAQAQVPDAGAQRIQMIEQLKQVNAKLDKVAAILESGKLQVSVATPDEK
jgi:hypothetical protein